MRLTFSEAVYALKTGQVVGIPTETVYGLAASINFPQAIEAIFTLKGRSRSNPLIIHVATIEDIYTFTHSYPLNFEKLAKAFWPGPLTCVLQANERTVPSIVRANLTSVGMRIPSLTITRDLLKLTGPLVMPSANLSGRPSSTLPQHLEADFALDFPVLDGGGCQNGVESTIISQQQGRWVIGRLGAISPEQFEPILNYQPQLAENTNALQPICPGQSFRHYAPNACLLYGNARNLHQAAAVLGFIDRLYPTSHKLFVLGSIHCPEEVAENLYQQLRQIDLEQIPVVWVDMDIPQIGLWRTIHERLTRAIEK